MHDDLFLVDSAFVDTKEYMDHMSLKINEAHTKFREFKKIQESRPNPEREPDVTSPKKIDFGELKKSIKKLKVQIPWNARIPEHVKLRSADSNRDHVANRHPFEWPNINRADDGMTQFLYKEPQVEHTSDYDMLFQAFRELPLVLQRCLLCFFKFPPEAIIKRTTMVYLWIGQGYADKFSGEPDTNEIAGNKIFNELVETGFIQPINQKCSLVPDSCKMSLFVRSALYERAKYERFSSNDNLVDEDYKDGRSCVINVGEAIINCEPKIFGNADQVKSLYLGRWQRSVKHRQSVDQHQSVEHHIEVRDLEILRQLRNLKILKFLSLRGISMITELPKCILELTHLNILDLRACYNLEAIPENIGLLKNLTHLDMSECYFLDHMPESLARLSNLEVLKGFLIGDFNKEKQSCTLSDLSRLQKLRKLNIYIGVKDFQQRWDFDDLKKFEFLQKLAISWGGCTFQDENCTQIQEEGVGEEKYTQSQRMLIQGKVGEIQEKIVGEEKCAPIQGKVEEIQEEVEEKNCILSQAKVEDENCPPSQQGKVGEGSGILSALLTKNSLELPRKLQKLDLQGFPAKRLTDWLTLSKVQGLEKLYIRGGQLCDFSQNLKGEKWNVKTLRLKYLSELKIDWSELRILFPELIYLHQEDCPKLTSFQCDKRGVWNINGRHCIQT